MTKHKGSFVATGTDGKEYVVHIHANMIEINTREGLSEIEGLKTLTTNGEHVNRKGKGHYQIMGGIDLRSDDPHAP
ncbi:MAG TPA: hypothetical protein VKX17_06995 [Planctomycetota bacterium]|nr:hypothetical protein [Planctomycetota bacterium]